MKAWEYTHKLTQNAIPIILSEDEQGWDTANQVEKYLDMMTSLYWKSNVPGSNAPESVIIGAVQSVENMGFDVSEVEKLLPLGLKALEDNDMQKLQSITGMVYKELENCPKVRTHKYWSYTQYENYDQYYKKIIEQSKFTLTKIELDNDFVLTTKDCWLARLVGGALGTAIEGYTCSQLEKKFGDIKYYIRTPNTYNDDITYEIALVKACLNVGSEPTSEDIANSWLELVPSGWSAEQIALDNLRRGIYPPESGNFRNPYKEWIGAQMRGAICGQVAPGNTELAARLAFHDAQVSHSGNGVLAEVFNAILVSQAFASKEVNEVLNVAISLIPNDSEYYEVINNTYELCKNNKDWKKVWMICEDIYKEYNWIHAYPNAAAEIIALYYGNGDFNLTLEIISGCGQDVDCNAAQISVVLAALNGHGHIEDRWIEPFGDTIQTYLRDKKEIKLEELVSDTVLVTSLLTFKK